MDRHRRLPAGEKATPLAGLQAVPYPKRCSRQDAGCITGLALEFSSMDFGRVAQRGGLFPRGSKGLANCTDNHVLCPRETGVAAFRCFLLLSCKTTFD